MPSHPRRLVAALVVVLAVGAPACSGGDAIPDEPAERAEPNPEETSGTAEGQNIQPQDPTDNLVEPDPGDRDDFSDEADQ